MRIGYARVSTIEQDNAMQIAALKAAKCDRIVEEKRSAVKQRPELDNLLQQLKQGDELVIYKLDRLARSLNHLLSIVELLSEKNVRLKSVTEPIDASTPAGRMFMQVLGSVAEFERALIRERCMAGQLEALRQGKRIGRPHKLTPEEMSEVVQLYKSGIPGQAIATAYGISESRVRSLHYEATGRYKRQFGEIRALL
ncbi:MAG: recombinase family protein [Pseudomonadota bacterium]|nr:recombinase family protein [Pseudomonadota bacterium]